MNPPSAATNTKKLDSKKLFHTVQYVYLLFASKIIVDVILWVTKTETKFLPRKKKHQTNKQPNFNWNKLRWFSYEMIIIQK